MRILIGLLCFLPVAVTAATWVNIAVSDNSHIEMDQDSVSLTGEQVKAWFKEETFVRKQTALGSYYRSAVTLEVFYCKERRSTLEQATFYTEANLSGNVLENMDFTIDERAFSRVIPGTLGELKMKHACDAITSRERQ